MFYFKQDHLWLQFQSEIVTKFNAIYLIFFCVLKISKAVDRRKYLMQIRTYGLYFYVLLKSIYQI